MNRAHQFMTATACLIGVAVAACAVAKSPGRPAVERNLDPPTVQVSISSELHPADSKWFTDPWAENNPEWRYKLSRQPDLVPAPAAEYAGITIEVDPKRRHQRVTGIGTSLDETSCYAMQKGKNDAQVKNLLRGLIDPREGAGYSLFRICFGTSDFSDARSVSRDPKGWYTYQDDPEGPFSIENDRKLGIVRVIKLAQEAARECGTEVRFVGTAWSPPAWMKVGNALASGDGGPTGTNRLREDKVAAYATYLANAVKAYDALGVPIHAITTNNEHYFTPENYPGCYFSAEVEAALTRALHERFRASGLATEVWIHDHNWDLTDTGPRAVLERLKADGALDACGAVAYHHYGGSPADMSRLHAAFPGKAIQFTEGSVWGAGGVDEIVQIFRNWSGSYLSWVPMSTQDPTEHNQGPYNAVGKLGPTLLIQRHGNGPDWYKTPEYYLIAQVSRFVRPGASRVESSEGSKETLTNVAFVNPDGSLVVVVVNQTPLPREFRILSEASQVVATLPESSVATYVFPGGRSSE